VSKGAYLGEFELVVLLALARLEDAAHGMAVYDEIVDATGRDVSVQAVYVTLSRLEKKGYVACRTSKIDASRDARARKNYVLLAAGREVLNRSRVMYDRLWAGVRLSPRTGKP